MQFKPAVRVVVFLSIMMESTAACAQSSERFPNIIFDNHVYKEGIASVQVYNEGTPISWPVVAFGTTEKLQLHFDELTDGFSDFSYMAIHCTPDWYPSELETNEYISGFSADRISDFESSFNTRVNYVHYQLEWPNDLMRPTISGNYLLVVYEDDDPEKPVITRRVVVFEEMLGIGASLVPASNPGHRYTHHEIDFRIGTTLYPVYDPMRDLRVTLLQNFNWQSAITGLKPTFIRDGELTYDHNGDNEFEAGNEYRDFDTKDMRYQSMEVENITDEGDAYHVYLRPDLPQGSVAHFNKDDLDGLCFLHNDRASDSNTEAEYHLVHFRLAMKRWPETEVYITGDFASNQLLPQYKLTWNESAAEYQLIVLMKQGYYNYRYVMEDAYKGMADISYTEGNFEATQNHYHILAYHFDRTKSAWRCAGFAKVKQQ